MLYVNTWKLILTSRNDPVLVHSCPLLEEVYPCKSQRNFNRVILAAVLNYSLLPLIHVPEIKLNLNALYCKFVDDYRVKKFRGIGHNVGKITSSTYNA